MDQMHAQRVLNRLNRELREISEKHFNPNYLYTDAERLRAIELKDSIKFYQNIYLNPVHHFWEILKKNSVKWSEVLRPKVGIKRVEFSQDLLFNLACNDAMEYFWFELKKQLPKDASLIDMSNQLVHYMPSTEGYFNDKMCCLFGSSEWERVAKGEQFPLFEIVLPEQLN